MKRKYGTIQDRNNSEEYRKNMSLAKKGIKHTKTHNKKISNTCKAHKINVKHGLSTFQHHCKDCKKKISWRAIRCGSCACKEKLKDPTKHPSYIKGKPKCIDCDKELTNYNSVRCGKCSRVYNLKTMMQKGCKYYKEYLMKSNWEIIYAKYLDKNNIKWLYESKTFDLGNTTYTPDFYLPQTDEYIEIKGWFRDDAKKKFRLFKKSYPEIKIVLIKDIAGLKRED